MVLIDFDSIEEKLKLVVSSQHVIVVHIMWTRQLLPRCSVWRVCFSCSARVFVVVVDDFGLCSARSCELSPLISVDKRGTVVSHKHLADVGPDVFLWSPSSVQLGCHAAAAGRPRRRPSANHISGHDPAIATPNPTPSHSSATGSPATISATSSSTAVPACVSLTRTERIQQQ